MENKKRTDLEECVIHYKGNYYLKTDVGYKKIILTTDQDLIKDGVQAIDDEFLEWFVKNPSCESVETIYGLFNPMGRQVDPNNLGQNHSQCIWKHKIIIPKEEPKQETLEEAADSYSSNPIFRMGTPRQDIKRGFELGAKYQQEQEKNKYSEEEVRNAIDYGANLGLEQDIGNSFEWTRKQNKWFEQFKKK